MSTGPGHGRNSTRRAILKAGGEIVEVFRRSGRSVPVYDHKHFSFRDGDG